MKMRTIKLIILWTVTGDVNTAKQMLVFLYLYSSCEYRETNMNIA